MAKNSKKVYPFGAEYVIMIVCKFVYARIQEHVGTEI